MVDYTHKKSLRKITDEQFSEETTIDGTRIDSALTDMVDRINNVEKGDLSTRFVQKQHVFGYQPFSYASGQTRAEDSASFTYRRSFTRLPWLPIANNQYTSINTDESTSFDNQFRFKGSYVDSLYGIESFGEDGDRLKLNQGTWIHPFWLTWWLHPQNQDNSSDPLYQNACDVFSQHTAKVEAPASGEKFPALSHLDTIKVNRTRDDSNSTDVVGWPCHQNHYQMAWSHSWQFEKSVVIDDLMFFMRTDANGYTCNFKGQFMKSPSMGSIVAASVTDNTAKADHLVLQLSVDSPLNRGDRRLNDVVIMQHKVRLSDVLYNPAAKPENIVSYGATGIGLLEDMQPAVPTATFATATLELTSAADSNNNNIFYLEDADGNKQGFKIKPFTTDVSGSLESGLVKIGTNGASTVADICARIISAINNSDGVGSDGLINIDATDGGASGSSHQIILTQKTPGPAGNTVIVENLVNFTKTDFTGGTCQDALLQGPIIRLRDLNLPIPPGSSVRLSAIIPWFVDHGREMSAGADEFTGDGNALQTHEAMGGTWPSVDMWQEANLTSETAVGVERSDKTLSILDSAQPLYAKSSAVNGDATITVTTYSDTGLSAVAEHHLAVGDKITILATADANYTGAVGDVYTVAAAGFTTTTFTYELGSAVSASTDASTSFAYASPRYRWPADQAGWAANPRWEPMHDWCPGGCLTVLEEITD